MSVTLLPLPQPLRPFLPTIVGNVDYRKMRDELLRIDELLTQSGTEQQFIGLCVEQWAANSNPSVKAQLTFQKHSRRALRCNILRTYLEEDFRDFAARLADSPLFQFFCGLAEIDRVVIPAKSTLQRYAHWLPESTLKSVVDQTLRQAHHHSQKLQLAQPANLEVCFLDTTCLKANIHYPVDWVLLRDCHRSLQIDPPLVESN